MTKTKTNVQTYSPIFGQYIISNLHSFVSPVIGNSNFVSV